MAEPGAPLAHELSRLLARLQGESRPVPERVGEPAPVRLTVGIATYDDFDGAFFTASSALLHHSEVFDDAEILILDNHPRGQESAALAKFARASSKVRYVPYEKVNSTAVRDVLFREAAGEVVVVLDSHVLLAAGALRALLDYYDDPAHAGDMVQGPLLSSDGTTIVATHMVPEFAKAMYGHWGMDERGLDPAGPAFEIELHGLGTFAMRRDAWPGLNPLFRGFGGEEGYIHEKVRRAGGRVVCLPAYRWLHRFDRPRGVPYPLQLDDRIHNYLVGWAEIGYDTSIVLDHFEDHAGPGFAEVLDEVLRAVEHPIRWVDGVTVVADPHRFAPLARMRAELDGIGIEPHVVALPRDDGPERTWDELLGAAVQRALDDAWQRGQQSILLIDEHTVLDAAAPHVTRSIVESAAGTVVVIEPAKDTDSEERHLPGALLIRSVAAVRDDEHVPRAELSFERWLAAVDSTRVRPAVDLGARREPSWHDLERRIRRGYVAVPAPHGLPEWRRTYAGFASWGLGRSVHAARYPWHPAGPGTDGYLRGLRRILRSLLDHGRYPPPLDPTDADASQRSPDDATPGDEGVTLLADVDLRFLRGSGDLVSRALRELDGVDWDVLTLSGAGPVDLEPGHALTGRRDSGNSGSCLLVNGASLSRVAEVLDADGDGSTDPVGFLLDRAAREGTLTVVGIVPAAVVTALTLTEDPSLAGRRTWYERPSHDD